MKKFQKTNLKNEDEKRKEKISKINPEDFLKEVESALNLVSEMENIDLEDNKALLRLKNKAEKQEKKLKTKYQNIIKENNKDNLDSKK